MPETKRIFLAIDIPKSWHKELAKLKVKLQKKIPDLRATPPRNYHLTITFYGDLTATELKELREKLNEIIKNIHSFEIKPTEFGSFYNRGRSVYWFGTDSEILDQVAKETNKLTREEPHGKFKSHITLGRLNGRKKQLYYKDFSLKLTPFTVNKLVLYESTNISDGPVYTKLHAWELN